MHRGTYTTQAKNKTGNRKCELLLRDAEFFDSVAIGLGQGFAGDLPVISGRAVYGVIGNNARSVAA